MAAGGSPSHSHVSGERSWGPTAVLIQARTMLISHAAVRGLPRRGALLAAFRFTAELGSRGS